MVEPISFIAGNLPWVCRSPARKEVLLTAKQDGKTMEGTAKGGLWRARKRGENLIREIANKEGVSAQVLWKRRKHGDSAQMDAMARLHLKPGGPWVKSERGWPELRQTLLGKGFTDGEERAKHNQ